jgi:RimJ/RimL family protein N-acetyltransferase
MFLKGDRVIVRRLTRADLNDMVRWRPFDDPLFSDANWPLRSLRELNQWYTRCSRDPQRLLCAVTDNSGRVIGSITLRERDALRSARLGVTLGADFVNQGLGTEALGLFLDYYFDELGLEKMVLDVVGYNQRAIRVYEKLGFVTVGQRERPIGRHEKWTSLEKSSSEAAQGYVRRDWLGRRWLLCYDMELTREEWERHRASDNSRSGTSAAAGPAWEFDP